MIDWLLMHYWLLLLVVYVLGVIVTAVLSGFLELKENEAIGAGIFWPIALPLVASLVVAIRGWLF